MTLRHVQRGQPLKIPADDWNRIVDATRAYHERQGQSTRPATADASGGRQAGVILVRNDSGADQPRFAILGIDAPIIGPDATEGNLEEFQRQVALTGVVPTRADHGSGGAGGSGGSGARFVVLLEPLAAGAIGRACVSGVCPAQVEVGHEQDGAATITDNDASRFTSTPSSGGGAQILWKEEGTGLKWAVVRLGPVAMDTFPARITGHASVALDHADYGKYAWEQVRWDDEADDGEGGTEAAWVTVQDGLSGTIAEGFAREVAGRPMVPAGTIVLMTRSGSGYFFSLDAAPPPEDIDDPSYATLDFDDEANGQAWFDRDHVHHGGPTSRYDPDAAIVPMPGSHSAGVWGAWFARFVSKLTGGEDPNDENYEEEHHDLTLGVERRVVHGDPAGHFQWVGPPGESEVEDGPPEIVLRHKAPGTTDWTITIEDDEQNVLGTITFDEKGHNNQSDHTITIPAGGECPDITGSASATTGSPGTSASADLTVTPGPDCSFDFDFNFTIPRGEQGEEGPQGPQGPKGDDADLSNLTLNDHFPWINVSGTGDTRTIQHGGPGALVDEQSIITSAIATGEDANAGGATLSLTAKLLRRDQFGHVGATADDDDNNVELSVPQVLGDLADATLTSPQDEQVLTYDGGAGAWVNQDLPEIPDLEDVVGDGTWISATTVGGQRKLQHIGPDTGSATTFSGFDESDKIKVDARGHITEIKGTNI
ncbi:MAG: hypothetical protein WD534_09970 [Phycisphaeraceae bacterium]